MQRSRFIGLGLYISKKKKQMYEETKRRRHIQRSKSLESDVQLSEISYLKKKVAQLETVLRDVSMNIRGICGFCDVCGQSGHEYEHCLFYNEVWAASIEVGFLSISYLPAQSDTWLAVAKDFLSWAELREKPAPKTKYPFSTKFEPGVGHTIVIHCTNRLVFECCCDPCIMIPEDARQLLAALFDSFEPLMLRFNSLARLDTKDGWWTEHMLRHFGICMLEYAVGTRKGTLK